MSDERRYQNRYGRYHSGGSGGAGSSSSGRRGYYYSQNQNVSRESRSEGYRSNDHMYEGPGSHGHGHSHERDREREHYSSSYSGGYGRYRHRGGYYNNSEGYQSNRYYGHAGIPTRPSPSYHNYPTQPSGYVRAPASASASTSTSRTTTTTTAAAAAAGTVAGTAVPATVPARYPHHRRHRRMDKRYSISTMAQGYLEIMDDTAATSTATSTAPAPAPASTTPPCQLDEQLRDVNCQIFKTMCDLAVAENQYARDTLNVQLTQEKLDTLLLS